MRSFFQEGLSGRDALAQRPDFDDLALLPVRHISAKPAETRQLPGLTALAARAIPALAAAEPAVARVHRHNPDSIWAVTDRGGREAGVFAMLILNRAGRDAVLSGAFDSADPALELLPASGEEAAAIYLWAIVTPGLAIEAFRVVSRWLLSPRTQHADIFTRPTTQAGLRLSIRLGFEPIQQIGLYRFRRHSNRKEQRAVA
jgi:hypothetical protein